MALSEKQLEQRRAAGKALAAKVHPDYFKWLGRRAGLWDLERGITMASLHILVELAASSGLSIEQVKAVFLDVWPQIQLIGVVDCAIMGEYTGLNNTDAALLVWWLVGKIEGDEDCPITTGSTWEWASKKHLAPLLDKFAPACENNLRYARQPKGEMA